MSNKQQNEALKMLVYDFTVDGWRVESESDIPDIANGMVWDEIEQTEQDIKYKEYYKKQ